MAKTGDFLLIGAVGLGVFFLLRELRKKSTSPAQTQAAFQNAGFQNVRQATAANDRGSVFVDIGKGQTVKFAPGDFDKLNFAQRFLIGADRFVPGEGLSRAVLT